MTRIRTVKPDYFLDPDAQAVSIAARYLFVSMWTQADDRGRLFDHPALICAQAFAPTDRVKPEALIAALAAGREPRILRYEANGKRLIAIRAFRSHQRISKPQESNLPAPALSKATVPFQGWTREEAAAHPTHGSGTVPHPSAEPFRAGMEVEGEGEGEGEWIAPDGTGAEQAALTPAPEPRRDLEFEALAESCDIDWHHLTEPARGALNAALKAIRGAGDADPAEIRRRARAYRATYPEAALTPSAIAKHWPALANGARHAGPSSTADRMLERLTREGGSDGTRTGAGAGADAGRSLPAS